MKNTVIIKTRKINEDAKIPSYAHKGDAGLDLFSVIDTQIKPMHRTAIQTGIEMEIPAGYVGLVWDKSGLSLKEGIKTMAGVIDSSYRGELKVVMINLSSRILHIKKGQKIAQILIQPITTVVVEEEKSLSETSRGKKGFGSTGK
ncbi:MAG: dUTP diphosphatase [archaeon]